MRFKWSLRQIVLSALISFLIGAAGLLMMFRQGALAEQAPVPVNMEKSYDGSPIESFSISANVADTTFVRSENGRLTVSLTGSINEADLPYAAIEADPASTDSEVNVTVRTGKQYQVGIDVGRLFYNFRNGFKSDIKVVVELPDKTYKALRAKTDTGQLTLPEIQAETLGLSSDTGDITLAGFTGKRLTADSDTGTMRLRHVSGELALSSDTGDLYVEADALPGGADLRTDTGDIQLILNQTFPVKVDFESDIGKTSASATNGAFSFEWKEKHKLRGELGSGGPLIKVRTDTGDIELDVK